jgi:hypothetical protein
VDGHPNLDRAIADACELVDQGWRYDAAGMKFIVEDGGEYGLDEVLDDYPEYHFGVGMGTADVEAFATRLADGLKAVSQAVSEYQDAQRPRRRSWFRRR